jgi:hypothetical protein
MGVSLILPALNNIQVYFQVRDITVFTVFRLLTDFVCLYAYEFWLSEFGNFVITLTYNIR